MNETCTYPQCKCIVGTSTTQPVPKCPRTGELVPEENFKTAKSEAHKRILQLAFDLLDVVRAAGPQGAPAGPMYAACMSLGMTLSQFERLMDLLVAAGKVRKTNQLYFAMEN